MKLHARRLVLYAVAFILLEVASAKADDVATFGGNMSCQAFLADKTIAKESGAWVFGVWTGMNTMAGMRGEAHDVGHTLSGQQLITIVLSLCQRQPSSPLLLAVGQAWAAAKSQSR